MDKLDPASSRIFNDLVEYSKLPRELVLRRCNYAVSELAILWGKKKNVIDFYREADLYIYDLTKYQLILEHRQAVTQMVQQLKTIKVEKVLEFGGGIGEFSILCSEQGVKVTYHDLDGEIKNYALWRFQKHKANVVITMADPLQKKWDLVNVMDVLEHLENPEPIISQLAVNARYIFCNPEDVQYNIYYPQHISKFDLEPYFERLEGYLWKNKNL
jgi:protein-L-isoaspartate O-methyltransferase